MKESESDIIVNVTRNSSLNYKKIRFWFFVAVFFGLSVSVGILKQLIFLFHKF
jgi:hypothetical protein